MSAELKIAVAGVSGRMGQMLVEVIDAAPNASLAAALDRPGHDWIGTDLGVQMGRSARGLTVMDDIAAACAAADVVIDFTAPAATLTLAQHAAEAGIGHVIGTTGMTEDDIARLASLQNAKIMRAGNMSLGVNLLVGLTRQVAAALDEDFDIEVIEAHHHHKVDAPSGTALMLGEAAAEGRKVSLAETRDSGRDGITGARKRGDIGFSAVRGGDIVGEHDVLFAGPGERIVLRHLATDRGIFARGAVKAALWLHDQPPGHYSMTNVLGLT